MRLVGEGGLAPIRGKSREIGSDTYRGEVRGQVGITDEQKHESGDK